MITIINKIRSSCKTQIFLILILGITAYSFSLGGSFRSMDDHTLIVDNESIHDITKAGDLFTSSFFKGQSYYRPTILLGYMIEYHFFGENPLFYTINNLILHLLNCLLVYFIIRLILKEDLKAFFVGLLFAIHPIQWEAVSNIAGRAIVLCATFFFLAMICYLLSVRGNKRKFYYLSLLLYIVALTCKETAITLPAFLLSYEFFTQRKTTIKKHLMASILKVTPFFATAAGYMYFRRLLGITNVFHWPDLSNAILGVTTFLRGVITFLRLFIFPVDLHYDRARMYFSNYNNPEVYGTYLFYVCLIFIVYKFRKKINPVMWFLLLWPVIGFLPMSQIVPVRAQFNLAALGEHFLYIPSVGIFALIVIFVTNFFERGKQGGWLSQRVMKFAVTGIFLFFFLMTIKQTILASKEFAMLKQSLYYNPENVRIRNSYALLLAKYYHFSEAEEQYRRALVSDPNNIPTRIGLGLTLCDQGRFIECAQEYEKITFAADQQDLLDRNKGVVYEILTRKYRDLTEREPDNPDAHYSLGVMYSRADRLEEAVESYKTALSLNPTHKNALFNLASSFEFQGSLELAIINYETLLLLEQPKDSLDLHAAEHLSMLFERLQNTERVNHYKQLASQLRLAVTSQESGLKDLQIKIK